MPTAVGPNTKGEENLVFGYDLGDVSNSYKGPPTKNQFGYQLSNGYLTSPDPVRANQNSSVASNNWGHWGNSGVIGNFGSNTDRNFIYFDKYDRSHWFEATSASPHPYLFYQVLPFEGQQFGAVDPGWGGGNPNSKPRTMTFVLKLHDESEITNAKVSPAWNGHVSYYPTPGSSNTSPTTSTPWTSVTSLGDGWYKCVAANFVQTGANDLTGIWVKPGYKCYVGFAQQEEYPFSTLLTEGTRSATQGLLDHTGNSTIDLTNVSFDSNAQMTFDGSDDKINLADAAHLKFSGGSFTIEQILTVNSISSKQRTFSKGSSGWSRGWHAAVRPTQYEFELSDGVSTPGNSFLISTATTVGTNHVAWVIENAATCKLYVNGVQLGSTQTITEGIDFATTTSTVGIGAFESGGEYFNGKIPYTKLYSRALTASEVKSNYNAIKGRFNI